MPRELVVISGKGGTGKTSIVASFAALAENKVLADCDVDAADLHLVLEPTVERREDFTAGKKARIRPEDCAACGACEEHCVFGAVSMDGPPNAAVAKTYRIDPISCDGCGVCVHVCPTDAIAFEETVCGQWFLSQTRHGPMSHAKLGVAQENSGKLVFKVRTEARKTAERESLDLILIDGPPGIGCPVIAALTGTDLALAVTEPTLSGLHDLERVARLARHFSIPIVACVNKCDINLDMTEEIERKCRDNDIDVIGHVRYAREATQALLAGQSMIEYGHGAVVEDVKGLWQAVQARLSNSKDGGELLSGADRSSAATRPHQGAR